jgi:hypothetical protein
MWTYLNLVPRGFVYESPGNEVGLISQASAEMPPKNGGMRKANWLRGVFLYVT